jgi:hypothetical protein
VINTQTTGPGPGWRGSQELQKQEIIFPNGNKAQLVAPPGGTPAAEILKALDIPAPKALILLIGGAANLDKALFPGLLHLFSQSLARVAAAVGALIIDGGTQAGVMAIMGRVMAEGGYPSPLLGVAPAGKVSYPGAPAANGMGNSAPLDPNHSYFVLVESGEWGGETDTLFELVESLANDMKVVTILVDGGLVARKELLASMRRGWPIIVIEGTGRLADEIARLKKTSSQPDRIKDPAVAEIVSAGDIHRFSLKSPPPELENLLLKLL